MRKNAENAYCLWVRKQTLRTKKILIYEKDYSYEKEKAPLGERGNKHEENTANKLYWTLDSMFLPPRDEDRCSKDAKILWTAEHPYEPLYLGYLSQYKYSLCVNKMCTVTIYHVYQLQLKVTFICL